jgi:hypothetical protein
MKRSAMKPRSVPLKRGGRIKPKKRSAAEFTRIYGSKARVAWIKAQPCLVCHRSPCDNAHTVTGGTGRKAGFETIVPLCRRCHLGYDQHRYPFNVWSFRDPIQDAAAEYVAGWLTISQGKNGK